MYEWQLIGPAGPDPERDYVAEKVAAKLAKASAKVDAKLAQASAKVDAKLAKASAKVDAKAEYIAEATKRADAILDRVDEHLNALDVWTRPAPASRRPRYSRAEIAATAVRIADTEGFAAVSMRRIANELGAGTMTLYHYVRTKDELLTLVVDAVMGEVVIPPEHDALPTDWRDALTMIAERTRAAMERHPWILDITDDPPLGPNSVRHFDQSLQAVASLDLDLPAKIDIVSAVDEYVFGFCLQHRNSQLSAAPSFDDDLVAYVTGLVASGDYPQLAALSEQYGLQEAWTLIDAHMRDPKRFERNLIRLLDGIEADVRRR